MLSESFGSPHRAYRGSVKKRPDKDPRQTIFTFCSSARLQEGAQQSLLHGTSCLSPELSILSCCGRHGIPLGCGVMAALLPWRAFAPQIILGHYICVQGLLSPSNAHFKRSPRQRLPCFWWHLCPITLSFQRGTQRSQTSVLWE